MNWEAIGAIGEIVGATAVVITIVYLAIQIRSNARATRASASFEASHSWAQFNEQMLHVPDDVLALTLKTYDPAARIEDLTEVEYLRMVVLHRTIFQKLEGQYFLFRYGSLEPEVWENRRRVARGILEIPFYRAWWENELKNSTYSDEFIRVLEAATPADVLGINRKPGESPDDPAPNASRE